MMAATVVRTFLFEKDSLWPSAHAASVVELPHGSLIASWFAGSREGAPDVGIWTSRYESGAWAEPTLLVDTPGKSNGNSVLWIDGRGHLRAWFVTMQGRGWATCSVHELRSSDGGVTWSDNRVIREDLGWMVRNEPVSYGDQLLMPMYDERDWSAFVLASNDGGDSWIASAQLRSRVGIIQPAIASLGSGEILMLLRSAGGYVYRSVSADGKRWSSPQPTDLPNPNSAVELIRLRSGSLLCVYNPTTRGRSPLRAALSNDGGVSWSTWRDLQSGDGEYSYPTAIQDSEGVIHVLYTHRREAIAHATFDEAWLTENMADSSPGSSAGGTFHELGRSG